MTRSRFTSFARVLPLMACIACGPPMDDDDGGVLGDGGAPASVAVRVGADESSLEKGMLLERFVIGAVTVRAPNDRGELARDLERSFELTSDTAELMLEGAEPAVYGSVELDLGSGAWGRALELRVVESSETLDVRIDEPIAITARCLEPVALAAGGRLVLTIELDVRQLTDVLRAGPLPAPVDSIVHVDRASAPMAVDRLVAALADGSRLECEESEGAH